ncbi:helix-turn-helix domain-containing protein [Acinetobacter pittii]
MSELSTEIGRLLRKKRAEKKITQEALALQCGIDRSYLGRIELCCNRKLSQWLRFRKRHQRLVCGF